MRSAAFTLVALVAVVVPVAGQAKKAEVLRSWNGFVEDAELSNGAPDLIANQKALDAIWKSWSQPEKAPPVDFSKELLVLATSRGSSVTLVVERDGKDLRVKGMGPLDRAPGFRYVMGVVSREGIETVNGRALPKEK